VILPCLFQAYVDRGYLTGISLKGEVRREGFLALASNKAPGKEENLTVRTKDKRTAGYDFCYSVPKSVSVYLA
jgi:hypothetical protein